MNKTITSSAENAAIASFWRRLGAAFYDALLVIGLWFLGTAFAITVLSLSGVSFEQRNPLLHSFTFQLYLLAIWYIYYAWSIKRNGQTLGMRAWRIKILDHQLQPVKPSVLALRFLAALSGLSNLWCLVNRHGHGLQDILTTTYVFKVAKQNKG